MTINIICSIVTGGHVRVSDRYNSIAPDIYGDTLPLLAEPVITIDLTAEQPDLRLQNSREKILVQISVNSQKLH